MVAAVNEARYWECSFTSWQCSVEDSVLVTSSSGDCLRLLGRLARLHKPGNGKELPALPWKFGAPSRLVAVDALVLGRPKGGFDVSARASSASPRRSASRWRSTEAPGAGDLPSASLARSLPRWGFLLRQARRRSPPRPARRRLGSFGRRGSFSSGRYPRSRACCSRPGRTRSPSWGSPAATA